MTALDVPVPQHLTALASANRIRLARAAIKRAIAAGETTVIDILACPPDAVATMGIGDLLMSQYNWGRSRCRRFLTSARMVETKTIGSLSPRQREDLAERLGLLAAPTGRAVVRENTRGLLHLVANGAGYTACFSFVTDYWRTRRAAAWQDEDHRCPVCAAKCAARGWDVVDV